MFSLVKQSVAGLQILFVAFGAMVLVPLLTGLNPSMALLGAGVGTLLFQLCTRRQSRFSSVPALPSSPPSSTLPRLGDCHPPCLACLPPVSCISFWLR